MIVIVIMLITVVVTSEGHDLFIDPNEFPYCRHSSNDSVILETLGSESNNSGVIIAGLALCRPDLVLHEICMRVKTYNWIPVTKIKLAIKLKPELGSCLMVAVLMGWMHEGLWRSNLANSVENFTLNSNEGLGCREGLELRVFSGQGAKLGMKVGVGVVEDYNLQIIYCRIWTT